METPKNKDVTPFHLLLDLVPSDRRETYEKIFEKHKDIQNEEDPLYVLVLSLMLFQNYLQKSTNKMDAHIHDFMDQMQVDLSLLSKTQDILAKDNNKLKNEMCHFISAKKISLWKATGIAIIGLLIGIGISNIHKIWEPQKQNFIIHDEYFKNMAIMNQELKAKLGEH